MQETQPQAGGLNLVTSTLADTTPAGFTPKQWEILAYAAEHPMGMANVGVNNSTAARALAKRGLVVLMGQECVQITDEGEATVKRIQQEQGATT